MENIIFGAIILIAVGLAVFYIVKEKKNGRKCIGCPAAGSCAKCQCACKSGVSK